jgi:hypothetical protein
MVLTVYPVISPVIGLCVTVALRIDSLSAPGWADTPPQDLTPASRRQNHTTSPSASAPFVCAPTDCSRQAALHHVMRAGAAASTASRPAFVTIAIAPLWDETARVMKVIWGKRKGIYFCKRGWTGDRVICSSGNQCDVRRSKVEIARFCRAAPQGVFIPTPSAGVAPPPAPLAQAC